MEAIKAGDAQWTELLDGAIARSSGDLIDGLLWKKLADQLLPLIGEDGFSSLYWRSLHLARAVFSWLPADGGSDEIKFMFAQLQICLRGRDAVEASQASHLLLLTFIMILRSLIGTPLMTNIIGYAWGNDAVD